MERDFPEHQSALDLGDGVLWECAQESWLKQRCSLELKLARKGGNYTPKPLPNDPLTPERFLNRHWRLLQNKSQAEKDAAFKCVFAQIIRHAYFDELYPLQRYHIAAAHFIRANMDIEENYGGMHRFLPIYFAVRHDDEALVRLLRDNAKNEEDGMYCLYNARKTVVAQAVIDVFKLDVRKIGTYHYLLKQCMCDKDYEADLVRFYKNLGCNPLYNLHDASKYNALEGLVHSFRSDLSPEKAQHLFEGLMPEQKIEFCEKREQRFGYTLFEELPGRTRVGCSKIATNAENLLTWLQEQYADAQEQYADALEKVDPCAICYESFDVSNPPVKKKEISCSHTLFHVACLEQWKETKPTCPICRAPLPQE
jgi:hypothetical protein